MRKVKGVRTLTGINSVFTYIVAPNGEVLFRKFPCFCDECYNMNFNDCKYEDLVGKARIVVTAGENIRKE